MGQRSAATGPIEDMDGVQPEISTTDLLEAVPADEDHGVATQPEVTTSISSAEDLEEATLKWRSWWFVVASIGFLGVAVNVRHKPVLAALAVLAALFMSAVPLRGPTVPHHSAKHRIRFVVTAILFSVEAFGIIGFVQLQFVVPYYETPGPILTILITTFGICALGIMLGLGVTWTRRNRWAEPLSLAAVTIALGAMTFAGLRPYMAVTVYPFVRGSALLYINGNPSYPVTLKVYASPLPSSGSTVNLTIQNLSSKHSVKWALLLVGDARLQGVKTAPLQSNYRQLSNVDDGLNDQCCVGLSAQLFWGTLQPAHQEHMSGNSNTAYMGITPTRTTVTLPRFGEGYYMQGTNRMAISAIDTALNGTPKLRAKGRFAVEVDSPANPVVVETDPPPAADKDDPATGLKLLKWTDSNAVAPSFMTFDQSSDDEARNALLVYAALLGIAGAGLLVSIQTAIHLVGSRK